MPTEQRSRPPKNDVISSARVKTEGLTLVFIERFYRIDHVVGLPLHNYYYGSF